MNIEELISKLEKRGINLYREGSKLKIKSDKPVPQGIMTTIKTYEKQLIKHLPASAAPIPIESDLKIVVSLKTPNLDSTRTTAETCADLLKSPPTRPEAVERLVATFRPEIRDAQRQRWLTTTLSGKPVGDAPEGYLLAEAVGIMAWVQEREERGVFNRGAYEWITAAWQAAERRAHHLKVA